MGLRFKWGNSNLSKIDESKGTYRYETNSGKTHEVNWMERNERHLTRTWNCKNPKNVPKPAPPHASFYQKVYPEGDTPGEERLYNSWESTPHLPGDLVETYHHEHPSSGGQEREYFSKRPRKVELNKELQFFKTAFHQQQLRDHARLQEKVSELKQQMEDRLQESIKLHSSRQKEEMSETIQKLQHQISVLNKILEERQATRLKMDLTSDDAPGAPKKRRQRPLSIDSNDISTIHNGDGPVPSLLAARLKNSEKSVLRGLGSTWCVAPRFIWKHVGVPGEPEILVRRKCITLILSCVLVLGSNAIYKPKNSIPNESGTVLLVGLTITALVIGLSNNIFDDSVEPISFQIQEPPN
ncbi:Oidioi.mRNA.OKI2018_I69.XSR.g13869.t1.cds [Oikopleura dioica]|uniref:Oidioi.mRNA.OKI2018_I69.XSR.g13869.t1.cds n=1 Tax=Oikopleura dioica TaxID=34765 RepID=A0ABN7SCW8_OIKDI|nr:Oidioi.mRNA.OKI2018_I69.XSR.g13869.t1.cds [Oikopleura dioica]